MPTDDYDAKSQLVGIYDRYKLGRQRLELETKLLWPRFQEGNRFRSGIRKDWRMMGDIFARPTSCYWHQFIFTPALPFDSDSFKTAFTSLSKGAKHLGRPSSKTETRPWVAPERSSPTA